MIADASNVLGFGVTSSQPTALGRGVMSSLRFMTVEQCVQEAGGDTESRLL